MRYNVSAQRVLALETSCDDSAAAILCKDSGNIRVLSSQIASQDSFHAQWGGVVPEMASRKHLESLPFLIATAIRQAELTLPDLDAIAATVAPGLAGSLMIGSVTGRALAALHGLPFLGIHHLEGHLASILLGNDFPKHPYLVLLVSGGHTELIAVHSPMNFERLGRSHDDAAGEAFDKVARLLGLPYPGGPSIQKISHLGDPLRFSLPKGRVSKPGGGFYPYDFSFSGLKTAMLRLVESFKQTGELIPINDLAASFEHVVSEVLVEKTLKCAIDNGLSDLVMVGGVASNKRLRKAMADVSIENGISLHLAPPAFCTDNAAMIGAAAIIRLEYGVTKSSLELGVKPRMPLAEASLLYQNPPPF